jgi:hypothetical protein
MPRTNHQHTEIVMKSRLALTEIESTHHWVLPVVTDIRRQAKQAEEEGSRAILTLLSSNPNQCEGYRAADNAAQRAARRQPREMRSASLSYVKKPVSERWKPVIRINKHIKEGKMRVVVR